MLQRYLEEMTTYTEGMLGSVEREVDHGVEDQDEGMTAAPESPNDTLSDNVDELSKPDNDIMPTSSVSYLNEITDPPGTQRRSIPPLTKCAEKVRVVQWQSGCRYSAITIGSY